MANISDVNKLLVGMLAMFSLFFPGSELKAEPVVGGLLAEGMLVCQPEKFRAPSVERNSSKNQEFFGTLGPGLSATGSVKTYIIKIVKKNSSSSASEKSGKKVESTFVDLPAGDCLMMPVRGEISSLFGRRRHPTSRSWRFHSGIDIVARKGTPIQAARSGKVTFCGWKRGYGMVVILDHGNGLETVYAHCSRSLVKTGQQVNTGQKIANVGSTGVATGSHLHFEVRRDGNVRNPMKYLSR